MFYGFYFLLPGLTFAAAVRIAEWKKVSTSDREVNLDCGSSRSMIYFSHLQTAVSLGRAIMESCSGLSNCAVGNPDGILVTMEYRCSHSKYIRET